MPVFNEYSYEALSEKDSIRLVVLDPSTDEAAPITCRIIEHRLPAPNLQYSAISHVWGQQKPRENLEISFDNDVRYLRITTNVGTILEALRKRDGSRYLWIDSICLNQNDEVEKAQQIPLMGDIYKNAGAVDIWLGPESRMTTRTFAFLRKLSRLPDVTKWKTQWEMAGRISFLMKKFVHHEPLEALRIVHDFFLQPWFFRRWVIQEACLAKRGTIHCGKLSISLQEVNVAAARFQRTDLSDYGIKVAANLGHPTAGLSMLELLWHFHDSNCLEPRDRLAAFRGLAHDGQDFRLDYAKPWEETFKDFTAFTYDQGCNDTKLQLLLHLFEFGPVSKKDDPLYPSWVPDWSSSRRRRLPYISEPKNVDTYEPYTMSPGGSRKVKVGFHHGHLQIHGELLALGLQSLRVSYTATLRFFLAAKDFEKQQARDVIGRLFPCISEAKPHLLAFTALLRAVSHFCHPDAERERTSKSLGGFEKSLRKELPTLDHGQLLRWLRTLESVLKDFCLVELEPVSRGSVTIQGYGIGPDSMLVDDIIIPLWSSQTGTREENLHIGAGSNVELLTVIAVRPIGGERGDDIDVGGPFPACSIIGPAICVIWTQAVKDSEIVSDSERSHCADWKRWFTPWVR